MTSLVPFGGYASVTALHHPCNVQEQKFGIEELEKCLADVEETWEEMEQEVRLLGQDYTCICSENVLISCDLEN